MLRCHSGEPNRGSIMSSKRGILVSFDAKGGETHLCLDDLLCSDANRSTWKRDVSYTSKPITIEQLRNLEFDEQELADFGYHILARLSAFAKLNELI